MSWKSLITAGLLCVLAVRSYGAPTVTAVGGGTVASNYLNASGQWVVKTQIATSNPLPDAGGTPPGTPLAAELGFTAAGGTSTDIISATKNATNWDTDNPGVVIFGWETLTNLGGGGACNSATPGNCPVGVQVNTTTDQVFSALGSVVFGTTAPNDHLSITLSRPITTNAATPATAMLNMTGAYSGKGRIAELTDATHSANYDTYANSVKVQAFGGDTNLDGTISAADVSTLLANYSASPTGTKQWNTADFNGDSSVTAADVSQLLANFGPAHNYTVLADGTFATGAGSGLGSGAVPEPASMSLLALAGLGLAGLGARRRG